MPVKAIAPPIPTQGVATFITKIWKILEISDYQRLISWSECGKNVIIHDYPNFSKEILPHYFKHNNFNSFVRQLNLYGFRKVVHPELAVLSKVQEKEPTEFWHPNFRRGHPELLSLVQRRPVSRISSEEKKPELNKVLTDIHQMKGKQENIGDMLEAMRRDNLHLKRDLELLREQHTRQQRILNKIIQFLVHMVYKGLPSSRGQRRHDTRYLMLTDSDMVAPPPKRGRVSLDPSPAPFNLSNSPFSDLSTLPVESTSTVEPIPIVEPIDSVPPSSSSTSEFTVTSPPPSYHMTSLDSTNSQHLLEPALTTSISSVLPLSITPPSNLPSEPPIAPPTTVTSPPISTNSPLPSPLTSLSSLPLLLAPPNPTTQHFADVEGDLTPDWGHLTGHIDSHQLELDSLPDFLSNHLSVDPTLLNQFISLGDPPVPEYDALDTARLLESLSAVDSEELEMLGDNSSQAQSALVPFTHSQTTSFPLPISHELEKDEPSSSLQELLDLKDTFSDT